jgi:Spy/CpxP family protein refolding chaperone
MWEVRMKFTTLATAVMIALGATTLVVASATPADAQSRAGTRCVHNGYFEGRWYCNVVRRTLGRDWRAKLQAHSRN